jgi:hypothetical protein
MTSGIAKTLAAALLLGASGWASASTVAIDLFKAPGVPGTGGHATVSGPCYCNQDAVFSPVLLLAPGTYDFGEVRDFWVQSGGTPDGGPDQPNLYLLFSPWEVSGTYLGDLPPPPTDAIPSGVLCAQDDLACNASFAGAFHDTRLIFTVAAGQDAIQIGFIGPYVYTPPLPEPSAYAMLVLGLAFMGGTARRLRQGRRAA